MKIKWLRRRRIKRQLRRERRHNRKFWLQTQLDKVTVERDDLAAQKHALEQITTPWERAEAYRQAAIEELQARGLK